MTNIQSYSKLWHTLSSTPRGDNVRAWIWFEIKFLYLFLNCMYCIMYIYVVKCRKNLKLVGKNLITGRKNLISGRKNSISVGKVWYPLEKFDICRKSSISWKYCFDEDIEKISVRVVVESGGIRHGCRKSSSGFVSVHDFLPTLLDQLITVASILRMMTLYYGM